MEQLKKAQEQEEAATQDSTQVVENDFLKAIVSQFQVEVKAGVELIREYYAMPPFISSEEKAVIDDFEGEEEYRKVVAATEYYLFNTSNLNLLESSEG